MKCSTIVGLTTIRVKTGKYPYLVITAVQPTTTYISFFTFGRYRWFFKHNNRFAQRLGNTRRIFNPEIDGKVFIGFGKKLHWGRTVVRWNYIALPIYPTFVVDVSRTCSRKGKGHLIGHVRVMTSAGIGNSR